MGDARIVLTTLIDEKLLTPGPKKLYVSYYRKRVYADLLPDGSIRYKDQVYTSPVPCALHMKRTLNPSLKTDAGWSSMYSAASGESLKDIKDRLNIRKRGTNARSAHKEKKAPSPSPTAKERAAAQAAAQAKHEAAPKCAACRKDAPTDVAECSACHSKTHFKCVDPPLQALPPTPWFCEKCLGGQADRILEFLQQTRRVLVERIAEQKQPEQEQEQPDAIEKEDAAMASVEEGSAGDKAVEADVSTESKDAGEAPPASSSEEREGEANSQSASVSGDTSREPNEPTTADSKEKSDQVPADEPAATTQVSIDEKEAASVSTDAKETEQEVVDSVSSEVAALVAKGVEEIEKADKKEDATKVRDGNAQLVVAKPTKTPSAEQKFLALIDSLIAEVSSKTNRANLIANSTGATLVHLEKTQLVQLVEYGKREILAATRPENEDDDEEGHETAGDHDGSINSEVDALIKVFDLRHQILSSQTQFERTTSALAKRTEKHLRSAETELMELEESRTVEARAISKVVDLIDQYAGDLSKCEQKIHYNEMLLESINHRRHFIRSSNINDRFVPAYRYSTKLMTTSSDQLLYTVLVDKLRDITRSVNEWTKMERHFEKMTSSLNKSLALIGTKRKRSGTPVKLPPTPALFAKVKIPPSRRLIERQVANYEVNLSAIRQNRARMRKTLSGILKIAREEHLSEEIVAMTDVLFQKCRDLKAEEEEEQLRLKEEAEAEAKAHEEAERAALERPSTDGGEGSAEEPEAKKQRLNTADAASNKSSGVATISNAPSPNKATPSSEVKGISSLLGSEDSDAKESSYSSAESKSRAENDEDSEGDLEQASRAIADITSSVMPEMSGGSDTRMDMLPSPPSSEKPAAPTSQGIASQGQFMIRGGQGAPDKRGAPRELGQEKSQANPKSSEQSRQSFLDQALEVLNKQQQQQQRLEQQRLEQQRRLEEQQQQLEQQQQQLVKQRQVEQQRQLEQQRLEQQRLEKERQERERQERERLEKQRRLEQQRLEKQRQAKERREQQRREQQRLEQERREQQRIEQQRIEEQRRVEEQRRLEQQRLAEQQQRLEQQRQEQQRQEKQRQEQQRLEQQRKEEQRQEQQRQEQQRRQQEQQRLELQRRQQEQQRQFQRGKAPSLPQVVPPGSSHLQMLNQQQQQQLQQQQAALQQQQHSRQLQHPLYGDLPKGMIMSSAMGTSQQDMYVQQAAQMGMDMHDVVRHQDSSHFIGGAPAGLRGAPYMPPNDVSRAPTQQPAPTAPRSSFYGDEGQAGAMHTQDVFVSQGLPGQQRQLPDHHMFTNELQQQQQQPGPQQSRGMVNQDFLMGRPYRGLNGNNMQHQGMDQTDENDVNMGDWGQ